jgi:hypothetical protein
MLDQAGIAAERMRGLLESGEDREAVLAQFVGALSDEDGRVLAALLRGARTATPPRA